MAATPWSDESAGRPLIRVPDRDGASNAGETTEGPGIRGLQVVVLTEHLSVEADLLVGLNSQANLDQTDTKPAAPLPRPARQAQRRFTAEEAAEIAQQYQAGQTMNQLARVHGVHRRTVAHCLQKQEVSVRKLGLPPEHLDQAAALYRDGWSLARLGEKYGTTDMTVRRALAKHGVEIRPRRGWK
jgi:lambda repressor-like predicted transcriptional regulator